MRLTCNPEGDARDEIMVSLAERHKSRFRPLDGFAQMQCKARVV